MLDKRGKLITASLTLLDIHDIARSARTYNLKNVFIAHPAPALQKLMHVLITHWEEGFGATYNPTRKEALSLVKVVDNLDQALELIKLRAKKPARLVATSAKGSPQRRISFAELAGRMQNSEDPFLLMLGTGWGMSDGLLERAEFFLEPIEGGGSYNHLSVRSACAIMLDRLMRPASL